MKDEMVEIFKGFTLLLDSLSATIDLHKMQWFYCNYYNSIYEEDIVDMNSVVSSTSPKLFDIVAIDIYKFDELWKDYYANVRKSCPLTWAKGEDIFKTINSRYTKTKDPYISYRNRIAAHSGRIKPTSKCGEAGQVANYAKHIDLLKDKNRFDIMKELIVRYDTIVFLLTIHDEIAEKAIKLINEDLKKLTSGPTGIQSVTELVDIITGEWHDLFDTFYDEYTIKQKLQEMSKINDIVKYDYKSTLLENKKDDE